MEFLGIGTSIQEEPRTQSRYLHARLTRRSPVRDICLNEAEAFNRRESFLQERKDRLAQRRHAHEQVLARGRADLPSKLQALRESLSAAQAARSAIYARIAANGSREVAKAHLVVQQNKERLMLERETKRLALELKQAEAEKRRKLTLLNRSSRRRSTSPFSSKILDEATKQEESSSRNLDPVIAAQRMQRFWRAHKDTRRAKNFLKLHLDHETAGTVPFDVIADVIKKQDVMQCAGMILQTLGIINSSLGGVENTAFCRTFLATYMILGHPKEILMREGPLENELINETKAFAYHFHLWLHARACGQIYPLSRVQQSWKSFAHIFEGWKREDSANLVEVMVAQYCELDLIYQIVKQDSDPIVAAEYHTAIRDNQLLLLARIRGIAGDETRSLIRTAVLAARRKRLPKKPRSVAKQQIAESAVSSDKMTAIRFFAIGERQTRLSNRQIVHELALDNSYQITKPVSDDDKHKLELEMKDNFFQSLESEMRSNRSASWVPIVVQECKMRLLRLVMPDNPTFKAITSAFDIPSVESQCEAGCYDYISFTTTVVDMMAALCAPARDSMVANIKAIRGTDDIDLFAKRIDSIFAVLDTLLLDSANFHLTTAAPRLIPEAIPYEIKQFERDVESGNARLLITKELLQVAARELMAEITARDVESVRHPENTPKPISVTQHMLGQVFTTFSKLPETLVLDIDRVNTYRAQTDRIVTIASLLMTAKNLMRGKNRHLNPLPWTAMKERLGILISETEQVDAVSIATEMNHQLDLAYVGNEDDREVRHGTMMQLVTKDKADDPVRKLLLRRLQTMMKDVMAGSEVTSTKISSAGLDDLSGEVQTLLQAVKKLADLNWACYRTWYTSLLE